MDHKDCFGSLDEVNVDPSHTQTLSKGECRNCTEIRDCLRYSKELKAETREKEELRKQELIAQIIDHSRILSNEIGSCLLEFLSRFYNSPIGSLLFKNLFLFHELPRKSLSFHLTVPLSQTMLDLIRGEEDEENPGEETTLHIILFQKSFPNHPKANMGMIAYEVAHTLASDDFSMQQIYQTLSEAESDTFTNMDVKQRTRWLIERWDFQEEFEAMKREMALEKLKKEVTP